MQAIAGVHFNYSLPAEVLARVSASTQAIRARCRNFARPSSWGSCATTGARAWLVTYPVRRVARAQCDRFGRTATSFLTELDRATWYAPFATSLRMSDLGYQNKTQGSAQHPRELAWPSTWRACAAAVTTEEPRYAAIGVVVDGEYRQLNANILQIENEYYSTIRPKPSKASKYRPLVALARNRRRVRRSAHARFEQRRPRRHESEPAAFHRSAADLLSLGRQPADLGGRAGRDRCARPQGGARRPSAGADLCGRRPRARLGERGLELLDGSRAPSRSCSTPTRRATSRPSTAAAEALREPDADAVGGVARGAEERASELFRVHAGACSKPRGLFPRFRARAGARTGARSRRARRSLEEAEALAATDPRPFEAYLRDYFAQA